MEVPLPRVVVLVSLVFGALVFLSGCSSKESKQRPIRGHTRVIQGVTHAEPAAGAERYCKFCHGQDLAGGDGFQPSCYSCHGKNWLDDAANAGTSRAPDDHTVLHGDYRHHPDLMAPEGTCIACHGADLQGSPALGRPGCELCHERLWEP